MLAVFEKGLGLWLGTEFCWRGCDASGVGIQQGNVIVGLRLPKKRSGEDWRTRVGELGLEN